MDPMRVQQVLDANMKASVKKLVWNRGWLLRMDKVPKHTSKLKRVPE